MLMYKSTVARDSDRSSPAFALCWLPRLRF